MSVPGTTWSWPEEAASVPVQNQSTSDKREPEQAGQSKHNEDSELPQPKEEHPKQKHYPPRTCRICLEVVPPTYQEATDGIPGIFTPRADVRYISAEPESGRLIRPCKCKGSQRYVHEGCLQAWRHADPGYARRNYWECPTCHTQYRLERMRWSRWISSTFTQLLLTVLILFVTVTVCGFFGDPIISFYLDPYDTIASVPSALSKGDVHLIEEGSSWLEHYVKGFASLGLLGFVKVLFAMSPWQWWNLRSSGMIGGGNRARRGGNGRDRLESISWSIVFVGVVTFLWVR